MDQLVNMLVSKVGIDQATAEKVVQFLKEHAAELPKLLGSEAGQGMMGKVAGMFGGGKKA